MFAHAQAPVRIGIAGGGSDLPAWTKERAGCCLTLAVAAYTHAVVIDRPDKQVIVAGRRFDEAAAATEIGHGLARESLLLHGFEDSVELHIASQLTSRGSGLGVSSSIAVALSAALARARWLLDGKPPLDGRNKHTGVDDPADIARDAWTVEIERLRRPIGRQDHMAAAWGGLRVYAFHHNDASVESTFDEADARWIAEHLLLVQLPDGHDARAILSGVKRSDQVAASYLAVTTAIRAIRQRDPQLLGRALIACHEAKKNIPGAVPDSVNALIEGVRSLNGAFGYKIAGAGGGGHLIVVCESGLREEVQARTGLPVATVTPDLQGVRSDGWV